jgi:hypothetical protein
VSIDVQRCSKMFKAVHKGLSRLEDVYQGSKMFDEALKRFEDA